MKMSHKITIAGGLVAAFVGFMACGSSGDMTGANGNGGGNGNVATPVEVQTTASLTFSPETVTIEEGTTVRWVNDSGLFHTVTPDGHTEWTAQDLSDGQTFEHTFNSVGTFDYYCEPHLSQGMTGTIVVESSSSGDDGY